MSNTSRGDMEKGEHGRYLDLRYRLLPYIYSQNAAVSFNGSAFDASVGDGFPEDRLH